MLSNTGNFLLLINTFLSCLIIYFSYNCLKIKNNTIFKSIYQISLLQSTMVLICFFTLIAAFIVSDFSLITVYQNSHSLKPLFYKISGTWGNHEGSLLLWVIILTIFSFLFLILNKNHPKNYRLYTLIIQNLLILGFLFFIIFNSNPFSSFQGGIGLKSNIARSSFSHSPPTALCWICWIFYIFFCSYGFNDCKLFWKILCTINKKLGSNLLDFSDTRNLGWIYMGIL